MEKLNTLLPWNKSKSESRSLLPPRKIRQWNHSFFPSNQQQETKGSRSCWPFLCWINMRSKKSSTSCYCKDEGPKSKLHPLSSQVIKRRNNLPSRCTIAEEKNQDENVWFSWGAFKTKLGCDTNLPLNEISLSNVRKKKSCCSNHFKSKWRTGLSSLDIWPKNTCNFGSHTQNLKSIITTASSWRWFQSSNSMLRDFLEDTEILKNMDAKDLNEYRELLLNEPLTCDRLQHYPKIVLRVFVFLLRNKQPSKNIKKKVLIELCSQWMCKNRHYFCAFEKKKNEILQNDKDVQLLNMDSSQKSLCKPIKWKSMKDDNDFYSEKKTATVNRIHGDKPQTLSDSKAIKLIDESRFEEQEQLVSGDEEKIDDWCTNENAESSNYAEGLDQTYCPCFICSNDDQFCYGCMCTICKDTGSIRDSVFWLKCKECAHVTHLQCATKAGFVGFNSNRKIDGEYWCHSCDAKDDMVPYWKSLLQEANYCNNMPRLEFLLYCAMFILKDTERPKYKDLQVLVCEAWALIVNGGQISDIHVLLDIIHSNFEAINDVELNPLDQELNLHKKATDCFKRAEEDIAGVQETLQELEAWKNVLNQTEEQLKRLKLKLELKTRSALLSRTAAVIARNKLHNSDETIALRSTRMNGGN